MKFGPKERLALVPMGANRPRMCVYHKFHTQRIKPSPDPLSGFKN